MVSFRLSKMSNAGMVSRFALWAFLLLLKFKEGKRFGAGGLGCNPS